MSAPIDDNQVPKIPDLALAVSKMSGNFEDENVVKQCNM